jgi:hypothetical protein
MRCEGQTLACCERRRHTQQPIRILDKGNQRAGAVKLQPLSFQWKK